MLVLPFVYGLIKRHVGCMGMLQRYSEGEWEGELGSELWLVGILGWSEEGVGSLRETLRREILRI